MRKRERCRERGRVRNSYPGNLFNSSFYAPLTNTIVPGRGASTPTFTRATTAWDFDNDNKLIAVPSGAMRFSGARLVRNLIPTTSEDITGFTKSGVTTPDATTILADNVSGQHYVARTCSGQVSAVGLVYTIRLRLSKNTYSLAQVSFTSATHGGSIYLNVDLNTGAYNVYGSGTAQVDYVSPGVWDVQLSGTATVAGAVPGFNLGLPVTINSGRLNTWVADGTESIGLLNFAYYNVSGESDYLNNPYVSVGVLSSPYHGAGKASGADGCKYFISNKDGSPVSNLRGYRAEPGRSNNCLWSRDFSNTLWAGSNTGSDLISNGNFASDTVWTKTGTATIAAGVATIPETSRIEQAITTVAGKRYSFKITVTTASDKMVMRVGTTSGGQDLYNDTAYRTTTGDHTVYFTATTTTSYVILNNDTAASGSIVADDATAFETGISVETTTGIDKATSSADRLTATANDATLMQLLTAATGTRTASVYVKRISGSGTVSLTRDGGTGWTDVTSSLVSGTWVRVSVTSDVGANPTVGIKMGTSGDVIDVDCFQDENSGWPTSPILTTTAAVTRNADVLTYASVFDVTKGSCCCSVSSDAQTGTSIYMIGSDSLGRLMYLATATGRTQGTVYDGASTVSASGSDLNTGMRKRGSRWGADMRASADGSISGSQVFDGSMGATGNIYIGCSETGVATINGFIKNVYIWDIELTNAQLGQVTK